MINFTAAATTDNGSAIDMKGFDSVTFIVGFGPIAAGGVKSVKVQQDATRPWDAADLVGTAITVADDDDNQVVMLEVNQPRERYVRVVLTGTQNARSTSVWHCRARQAASL